MTNPVPNPALLPPVGAPAGPVPAGVRAPSHATEGPGFAEVLRGRSDGVQFSGHALERVQRRGIDTSPQTLARLDGAVQRAAAKGARESLVLLDGTAFVVSVRNRTVITAVDAQHMREQVFTNIDSAVIG
jgi:flagellar operon protein